MFGHQDDQSMQQDTNAISDQSIEGALASEPAPGAQTVQPSTDAMQPVSAPTVSTPTSSLDDDTSAAPVGPATDDGMSNDMPSANDLIDIKQQALTQLSPLLGHLDQTAEEKFRTTMMMIQASDNQSLIKTAFEAAQNITDEKVRARALLDIVNEINYFTQRHESEQPS